MRHNIYISAKIWKSISKSAELEGRSISNYICRLHTIHTKGRSTSPTGGSQRVISLDGRDHDVANVVSSVGEKGFATACIPTGASVRERGVATVLREALEESGEISVETAEGLEGYKTPPGVVLSIDVEKVEEEMGEWKPDSENLKKNGEGQNPDVADVVKASMEKNADNVRSGLRDQLMRDLDDIIGMREVTSYSKEDQLKHFKKKKKERGRKKK